MTFPILSQPSFRWKGESDARLLSSAENTRILGQGRSSSGYVKPAHSSGLPRWGWLSAVGVGYRAPDALIESSPVARGSGMAEGRGWGLGGISSAMWICWSPPAPPPTHWYGAATRPGTGEPAVRGSAAPFQRERETHHPLGSDTASSLDAIKPGRHRRLQQGATAPGGSQTRASQCGASLSTSSLPEIQAKEACCPTAMTDLRGGGLNLQGPFIPGVGVGSLKSLGNTGWGGG